MSARFQIKWNPESKKFDPVLNELSVRELEDIKQMYKDISLDLLPQESKDYYINFIQQEINSRN